MSCYLCFIHLDESWIYFFPVRYTTDVPQLIRMFSKRASFDLQYKWFYNIARDVIRKITLFRTKLRHFSNLEPKTKQTNIFFKQYIISMNIKCTCRCMSTKLAILKMILNFIKQLGKLLKLCTWFSHFLQVQSTNILHYLSHHLHWM